MTSFPFRAAAKLWASGSDTTDIAKKLHLKEASVWNRLTEIKRLAKVYLEGLAA